MNIFYILKDHLFIYITIYIIYICVCIYIKYYVYFFAEIRIGKLLKTVLMSDLLKRQKHISLCFGFAENDPWCNHSCILTWKSYILTLSTGCNVHNPGDSWCLPSQFILLSNSSISQWPKHHFWKVVDKKWQEWGRIRWGCRGCVLRRCRLPCLQGPGSCVGLAEVGGWQVGGNREVCGAWRIRVLQIQNIWNPEWAQPNPPGVPGCRCSSCAVSTSSLTSSYMGSRVQGWVGSDVCVREGMSQAWGLVRGEFSPLQCSLSTHHIL